MARIFKKFPPFDHSRYNMDLVWEYQILPPNPAYLQGLGMTACPQCHVTRFYVSSSLVIHPFPHSRSSSFLSMNPEDDEALYLDEDFIALLANLDLADLPGCSNTPSPAVNPSSRHAPPPRTPPRSQVAVNISPSPRTAPRSWEAPLTSPSAVNPSSRHTPPPRTPPHSWVAVNISPSLRTAPRSREAPLTSPSTPSRAPATPHSAITTPPRTHPHTSPHAGSGPTLYHFESPTRRGYTHDWAETKPLVNSVPNNIFRGYYTVAEAQAAFQYALQRSWVRSVDTPVTAIPALPLPAPVIDSSNPLNGDETLDDTWYIVYRGITPGVYRSHLESQLNTLGIPGAIHESVEGKAAALDKYNAAVRRGEISILRRYHYNAYLAQKFEASSRILSQRRKLTSQTYF
ncbi:hypothetical protein B0H11DRAFT_1915560 [Mycena galericulata]|nr:hypothetical protein B0H11DRAFT_1915560 [Mycena galericulata]